MIDIYTELQLIATKKDKYTEWQMLRQLKEMQDALDETPNSDPYENMCIIFGKRSTGHLYYDDLDYFKGTCGIIKKQRKGDKHESKRSKTTKTSRSS